MILYICIYYTFPIIDFEPRSYELSFPSLFETLSRSQVKVTTRGHRSSSALWSSIPKTAPNKLNRNTYVKLYEQQDFRFEYVKRLVRLVIFSIVFLPFISVCASIDLQCFPF